MSGGDALRRVSGESNGQTIRWIAGATVVLAVGLLMAWAYLALGAVGELDHNREQGGCYLPRVGFGIALLTLAALGAAAAMWTLRAALRVARGKRAERSFLMGVPIAIVLAGAVVAVVLTRPDLQFGPC